MVCLVSGAGFEEGENAKQMTQTIPFVHACERQQANSTCAQHLGLYCIMNFFFVVTHTKDPVRDTLGDAENLGIMALELALIALCAGSKAMKSSCS
jgi:hypothetical protein